MTLKINNMHRNNKLPKIYAVYTRTDLILEIVAGVFLVAMWGIAIWLYNIAPDKIPVHFNFQGEVNRWGNPEELFFIAGLGTFLFVIIIALSRASSRVFNFPFAVNKDNLPRQLQIAVRMMRSMCISVLMLMISILFLAVSSALGLSQSVAFVIVNICTIILLLIIIIYTIIAWLNR